MATSADAIEDDWWLEPVEERGKGNASAGKKRSLDSDGAVVSGKKKRRKRKKAEDVRAETVRYQGETMRYQGEN